MSRSSESSPQPKGSLPVEQIVALRWVKRTSERFLSDPEICTWARNQFIYEKVTLDTLTEKFFDSAWIKGEYEDLAGRHNIVRNSFSRLRFELLTPEEIVQLNQQVYSKASLDKVKVKGETPWQEQYLEILRKILSEPGAIKERLNLKFIAKEFQRIAGRRVDENQMSRYIQRMREREDKQLGQELSPSQQHAAAAARARNIARDALMPNAENDQIVEAILENLKASSLGLNLKYILGRFAEITGEVVDPRRIQDVIRYYGLLTEKEIEPSEQDEE